MTEATATTTKTPAKPKAEVTKVQMDDGREVDFVGKRNLNKDAKVNEDGSVTATFDFRNGTVLELTIQAGDPMMAKLAGHGLVQKGGDEAAGVKDEATGKPDVDSMALAVEAVLTRMANREAALDDRWFAERAAGDGFSGASVVIQAIMEASKGVNPAKPDGLSLAEVKAFLEKKLEAAKAKGEPLTRQAMYAAYRKPGTKTAVIIQRLEAEKAAKAAGSVDADAELAEMVG